ncbi:MAG: hypothetical protein AMXMBFR13_41810 [Phycisphaerae bacterium]
MDRTHFAREFTADESTTNAAPHHTRAASQAGWSRRPGVLHGASLGLLFATLGLAQPSYTFTSGFQGDGFQWPASPTGLLDGDGFFTPDGIGFYNYIGNNLFFDIQYQVVGNADGFDGDALWGNPTDMNYGSIDIDFYNYGPVQTVGFHFAWSAPGFPEATPDAVEVYLEDSEGRSTYQTWFLGSTFTGLGGFDGYSDYIYFEAYNLYDDYGEGEPFVDIAWIYINLNPIIDGGPSSEFGIDNFEVDRSGTTGELYPSVNGGSINISGSGIALSALRGPGTESIGLEVTNGSSSDTIYSTQLLPGGDLTDEGQINNAFIASGQTIYTPHLASIDQSLPSGEYTSTIRVINEDNPQDPDDDVNLFIRLFDSPDLTAPSPVDVTGGQDAQLSNAAAPANGFRASVKVTGTSVSGPFEVTGLGAGTPVRPGETVQAQVDFERYGQLSGEHSGTLTASLEMAAYAGLNQDIQVFLADPQPVPNQQWTLNATLADMLTDSAGYSPGAPLGPGVVGVNSSTTAGTLLGGTANSTGNVSMELTSAPTGDTTSVVRQATDADFSTAVPVHVVQITYRDIDLCPSQTEGNLRLLAFDSEASDWELAVNGNSDGGAGASFFSGSFDAFAATLGGNPLSSALGTHGLDTTNNHVWAVLDHEGMFGAGEVGVSCLSPGDLDEDGDVDQDDLDLFNACASGPAIPAAPACQGQDYDDDGDVDHSDYGLWQRCYSGADNPADPGCMD